MVNRCVGRTTTNWKAAKSQWASVH